MSGREAIHESPWINIDPKSEIDTQYMCGGERRKMSKIDNFNFGFLNIDKG